MLLLLLLLAVVLSRGVPAREPTQQRERETCTPSPPPSFSHACFPPPPLHSTRAHGGHAARQHPAGLRHERAPGRRRYCPRAGRCRGQRGGHAGAGDPQLHGPRVHAHRHAQRQVGHLQVREGASLAAVRWSNLRGVIFVGGQSGIGSVGGGGGVRPRKPFVPKALLHGVIQVRYLGAGRAPKVVRQASES